MGNSIVHPVLWAIQISLPPAAGDRMVQAIRQKMPARIDSDRSHHVVFWQGLDKMLWKKRRRRISLRDPCWVCCKTNTPCLELRFYPVDCKIPLLKCRDRFHHTNTINIKFPEQHKFTRGSLVDDRWLSELTPRHSSGCQMFYWRQTKTRINSWGIWLGKGQDYYDKQEHFRSRVH